MQKNIYSFYLINIIFMMIPVSFILGSVAINLNVLILLFATIISFVINKQKINLKLNFFDKLIIIFFLYTLFLLVINYIESKINLSSINKIILSKTIFYQRFLFFYFLVRILLEKKILNLKWFIVICALCASFVCFDIFFQFIFGKDVFGLISPSSRHYSAIFGEELIAGSYLQKFGLFILVYFQLLKKNSIFKNRYIFPLLNLFILSSIILSGNRVPLFLFLLSLLIYSYLNYDYRKNIIKIFFLLIISFSILLTTKSDFKTHYFNFYKNGLNLISTTLFKDLSKENPEISEKPYVVEFYCSKVFIKKNPIFGGGIRSYRTHPGGCLTHSHNYYLEILVDLGIVGFFIILFIIFYTFKKIKKLAKGKNFFPIHYLPFLIVLLTEFFPFRTSGSIFSTNNSTIIFLFLAILISFYSSNIKYKQNNQARL